MDRPTVAVWMNPDGSLGIEANVPVKAALLMLAEASKAAAQMLPEPEPVQVATEAEARRAGENAKRLNGLFKG